MKMNLTLICTILLIEVQMLNIFSKKMYKCTTYYFLKYLKTRSNRDNTQLTYNI